MWDRRPFSRPGTSAVALALTLALTSMTAASTTTSFAGANGLIWKSDFENGSLANWSSVQACPGAVSVVRQPVKQGRYAARFRVTDADTHSNCREVPTQDPRAQLVGPPGLFKPGDDVYIGFSTYFKSGFPAVTGDAWLQVFQLYGPPFGGSPTLEIAVRGNRLTLNSQQDNGHHTLWESHKEIAKGAGWESVVLRVKWSTDPDVGFVELWHNGTRQVLRNGQQRLRMATFVERINGTSSTVYANLYRSSSAKYGATSLLHDDIRVGATYQSVAR